jgi:hypothetical protein
VKRLSFILLLLAGISADAQSNSFRVQVPNEKGKEAKATLTFNDKAKVLEVRPAKRAPAPVIVPYSAIDRASYEYTTKRKLELAPEKAHWLEIVYHDGDNRKVLVLRMKKHDAVPIQDALKAHTGIDAEVLGNADKRHGPVFGKH